MTKICKHTVLKNINKAHIDFANMVRTAIRAAVDDLFITPPTDEPANLKWWWGCTLGVLMYDVSGSVLLLLAHGEKRAPMMLNRSIFEYQIRLRYYCQRTDKAGEAIAQIPERFKKMLRVDPVMAGEIPDDERAGFDLWLNQSDKIAREQFRSDVLQAVVGKESADMYYDGYYGKASGHVHGYETTVRDVYREFFNGLGKPKLDYQGKVFPLDDTLGVCIHNLLDGLCAIESILNKTHAYPPLEREWQRIQ